MPTNHSQMVQNVLLRTRVLARFQESMEHTSPEAMREYLHEHPNADPKNHTVKKDEGSGGHSDGGAEAGRAKKRFDETKKLMSDMTALKGKVENADHAAAKKFNRAYDKIFEAGEAAVKEARKLVEKYSGSDAASLLGQHIREWETNKADHHRAADAMTHKKMEQAKATYSYAQQLDSMLKDFPKLLRDPDATIDRDW